jgi:hypothetical protein
MRDEEQVSQARTPAALGDAGETPVERLKAVGVRGILRQLAPFSAVREGMVWLCGPGRVDLK